MRDAAVVSCVGHGIGKATQTEQQEIVMNTFKKTFVAIAAAATLAATALTSSQASAWGHGGFGFGGHHFGVYGVGVYSPGVVYGSDVYSPDVYVYGSGGHSSVGYGRGWRGGFNGRRH
jgi:hypothetical protein